VEGDDSNVLNRLNHLNYFSLNLANSGLRRKSLVQTQKPKRNPKARANLAIALIVAFLPWPHVGEAQQSPKVPRVAYLAQRNPQLPLLPIQLPMHFTKDSVTLVTLTERTSNLNIVMLEDVSEHSWPISCSRRSTSLSLKHHLQLHVPGLNLGTSLATARRRDWTWVNLGEEVVELHGEKIWVQSEIGKRSTFRFTLPINSAV